MPPDLKLSEALSQLVFVDDYCQLVFQDEIFNIYNVAEFFHKGISVRQGESGFCDALVGLIGQRVISVTTTAPEMLLLNFERGACFRLLTDDEGVRGPGLLNFAV